MSPQQPWRRILGLARAHVALLSAGTFSLLVGSAASLTAPMLA